MIELILPTMTCGHCVKTVSATLQQLDAQARVQIDLANQKVQVESSQPDEAIRQALTEQGYPPR